MSQIFQIAVIDDHPLVLKGVIHTIQEAENMEVVATGETAAEAIDAVTRSRPDILVLDLSIPGGGALALREIKRLRPDTKVLVLTVSDDEDIVLDLIAAGASGYVLKGTTGDELITAIREVGSGGQYITPTLAVRLISGMANTKQVSEKPKLASLTGREQEIAELVSQGKSNKVIARSLGLSEKTIKHNLTNVFRKTQVTNRRELAALVRSASDQP